MSGSIGKALSGLLILELSPLQMCSLEKNLLGIDRDLASESFKQSLGWIGVINQLGCILMKQGQQIFQLCSDFLPMRSRLLEKNLLPRLHLQKIRWRRRTGCWENLVPEKEKELGYLCHRTDQIIRDQV